MWPDCSKNCDALDDIERHVRSHLGPKCDAIGDEDFYYEETEVDEATYLAIFNRTNTLPMSPSHNSDGLSSGQSFASSSAATSPVCSNDSSSSSSSSSSSAQSSGGDSSTSSALSSASSTSAYPASSANYANSIDWNHFLACEGQLSRLVPATGSNKWLPVSPRRSAGQLFKRRNSSSEAHNSPGRPSNFISGKRTRNLNLKDEGEEEEEEDYGNNLLLQHHQMEADEEENEEGELQFHMELDNPSPPPALSSPGGLSSATSGAHSGARSPPSLLPAPESPLSRRQSISSGCFEELASSRERKEVRQYLAKQQLLDHTYTNQPPPSVESSPTRAPAGGCLAGKLPAQNSPRPELAATGTGTGSGGRGRRANAPPPPPLVVKRGPGRRPKPEGYHLGLIVNGSGGCYQRQPKASSTSSISSSSSTTSSSSSAYSSNSSPAPNSNRQQNSPSSSPPSQQKSPISASKQIDSNVLMQASNNSGQILANHHNHLKHNPNKQFFHNQSTSSQRNNYNSVNNNNYLKGLSRSGGSPSGGGGGGCPTGPATSAGSGTGSGRAGHKRSRGEARKCRKIYGMEQRDTWCIQCKWKKACSRFPL